MPFDNNPSADIEMPFGKHAGKPLSEVPPQYLRWAYYDCNFETSRRTPPGICQG